MNVIQYMAVGEGQVSIVSTFVELLKLVWANFTNSNLTATALQYT